MNIKLIDSMKNSTQNKLIIAALLVLCLPFVSCTTKENGKPSSGGKTLEMLVVTDGNFWSGVVGDSIRAYFLQIQPGLNQPESIYDVASLPEETFLDADMFQHHRNILIIDIKSKNPKDELQIRKDFWAAPQHVFKFSVRSQAAFFKLFNEKRELILKTFYQTERERISNAFRQTQNPKLKNEFRNMYKLDMIIPEGFNFAVKKDNFCWLRKETKDFSQGILLYSFPYSDTSIFENKEILKRRDSITKAYIPGPSNGSFMTSEKRFDPPFSKAINLNGLYAVETRGLWKLEHDFMGGPFLNYVLVDEKNKRALMIDAYLYNPRRAKRDLLMQLEAIIYSLSLK